MDQHELTRITGSKVLAAQMVAIKDIALALLKSDDAPPQLSDTHTLVRYLHAEMGRLRVETCKVVFLDGHNRVLHHESISSGTVNEVHIHIREIFRRALELDACALIVAHNHPSGIRRPSAPDIAITKDLLTAAKSLRLVIHDHLIVTSNGVSSMRQEGWVDPWE